MRFGALAIAAAVFLCGCARLPPVYSEDGAALTFSGNSIEYSKPGQVKTHCQFDSKQQLTICEDGTASKLIAAGLPSYGVVLIDFDGRRFVPKLER